MSNFKPENNANIASNNFCALEIYNRLSRNSIYLLNTPKFIYHAGGIPIHYIMREFFEGTT